MGICIFTLRQTSQHMSSLYQWIFVCSIFLYSCNLVVSDKEQAPPLTAQPASLLVHDVFLSFSDTLYPDSLSAILAALNQLSALTSVHRLYVGSRAETGDPRLFPDFNVALHVEFTSEENMRAYADDSLHLAVRMRLMPYLTQPPVVFDYWVHTSQDSVGKLPY